MESIVTWSHLKTSARSWMLIHSDYLRYILRDSITHVLVPAAYCGSALTLCPHSQSLSLSNIPSSLPSRLLSSHYCARPLSSILSFPSSCPRLLVPILSLPLSCSHLLVSILSSPSSRTRCLILVLSSPSSCPVSPPSACVSASHYSLVLVEL